MNDLFETERASLVCMDMAHIDDMNEMFHLKEKEALAWVHENILLQKEKRFSVLNVFDKKTKKYIGYCGCREILLKEKNSVELLWNIFKEFKEDDIDIEVVFAVRNYIFKHFNIDVLVAIIPVKESHNINIAEAIDMEYEFSFFEGFHKFCVYVVNRHSEKCKVSLGEEGADERRTSSRYDENAPRFIRNLRRPRPQFK